MKSHVIKILMAGGLFSLLATNISAQCMVYPVSFEQRVSAARYIVLGKVTEKHTYIDVTTGNVNTLNKLKINAWLKNHSSIETVYVITLGGVYGNIATQVDPALQLDDQHEYVLMLEGDNVLYDDKSFRRQQPQAIQLLAYADRQGCFVNNNNTYYDISDKTFKNETALFGKIWNLTGEVARKPAGEAYAARMPLVNTPGTEQTAVITGFSPSSTRGGTILPGDFITITGSGFGAVPGTVFFTNADDGGATFTSTGVASDNTAWSDGSITVKVPANAGTGPINVNGAMTSATNLTVNYGHTAINNSFSGFGTATRQRYYHRNMNTLGGYTFLFNTTSGFSANTAAVAAFERALATWRCGTFINWRTNGTTANGLASDGINVVMFDGSLPVGVLGRATSRFNASASGGCTLANTVWCVSEIDIQFYTDPPTAGFPWEYGPALPSFTEYDFESVALHELGHGHGLQHTINPGAAMHFAIANGVSSRALSGNDVAGGNARMFYSTVATCLNPASCGTGPMTTVTPANCVALPVGLLSFSGNRTSPTVNNLTWSTVQEQNSHGFYIQRSSNGSSFDETGFVPAAGNSNQLSPYKYDDKKAGPYSWYYRLKLTNRDYTETYSNIIFIEGDKSTDWKVWAGDKGKNIFIYSSPGINADAVLKLFALNGQQVMIVSLKPGNNKIPVTNLPGALYIYQLAYDEKQITGKLLIASD